MIRSQKFAALALVIAACCLDACGAPKGAPAPTGTSAAAVVDMAQRFCDDLASTSYKQSISRAAVRAAEAKLSRADQDAVIEHAAELCPNTMQRAAP
ncbi:hypothetical protein ACFVTM_13320 [Arthrobacter sp. NPDC058130]|uniref:hypothetical protein n=1 Tax=Arthrobacter sp. NPDC058130 TaxID=3346353 RepID=UPI0036E5F85B